jgi:hypothetical protein
MLLLFCCVLPIHQFFVCVFPKDSDWIGLDSLAAHHALGAALPQHVTGFVLPKPDAGETAADTAAVHAACQLWITAAMTDLAAAARHALSFVDGLTALALVRDGLWRGLQPKANLHENVCAYFYSILVPSFIQKS